MLNGKKKPKRRKKRIKLSPKASRVLNVLKGVALRFSWAARLVIGAVLFTPILVYMVYINYTVDRQGVFSGRSGAAKCRRYAFIRQEYHRV